MLMKFLRSCAFVYFNFCMINFTEKQDSPCLFSGAIAASGGRRFDKKGSELIMLATSTSAGDAKILILEAVLAGSAASGWLVRALLRRIEQGSAWM